MKRLLLALFALSVSLQSFAQDPELLRSWFLTELIVGGTSTNPPSNSEVPVVYVSFYPEGNPDYEFETTVCDWQTGLLTYAPNNSELTFDFLIETLGGCDEADNLTFQLQYFSFYAAQLNLVFSYDVTTDANGVKTLTVINPDGDEAIYINQWLHTFLFRTWYLEKLILNGTDLFVPVNSENITPSISFAPTQNPMIASFSGDSSCNIFNGTLTYDAANYDMTLVNHNTTTNNCSLQVNTDFEAEYFSFLLENLPETFSYSTIEIDGERFLAIGDTNGDWAIYHEELLSTTEFEIVEVSIFPNLVSDILYIASEGITIENLSVYSISGQQLISQSENTNAINVSALSEGIYFIEIHSENRRHVQKFIKK